MMAKLYRSQNDRVIAGVFGGIAEYFGWSATLLRWIFVLSIPLTASVTLFGGILFYLIMWLVMPNAPTRLLPYEQST